MTLRLVVLLSGGGRTLLNLLDEIEAGRLDAEVVGVVSSRTKAKGVERAAARGLDVEVIRRRDFASAEAFARHQTQQILAARPDLVIMAGYLVHYPVPPELTGRILNIHPSLLPKFGGRGMYGDAVHAAVLEAGESESGCTVHVVDDQYDSGPVVRQARVPVRADDTVDSLATRVFAAECEAYPAAIREYGARLHLAGDAHPQ